MNRNTSSLRWIALTLVFGAPIAGTSFLAISPSGAQPKTEGVDVAKLRRRADSDVDANSPHRVSVEIARDRAAQLHAAIESTLHAMHRHYFHRDRDRATVPARALEGVFSDIARESKVDVRWIAVNTPPMSIDHEPNDDFERKAAKEIAAGKSFFDRQDENSYRRAGAISLGGSCLGCHTSSTFGPPARTPRYAGLVISVPIKASGD